MRERDPELNLNWGEIITPLEMVARDGKRRKVNTSNTRGLLRIIQSISSPNAEPFKQWLAQIGNERIEEFNDPELGIQRARERAISVYQKKGMSEKEIKIRLSGIETRHNLTDVWKNAEIEGKEYPMLTNLGYSWTELDAEKMRKLKGLTKGDVLRDHFDKREMILTELAEDTAMRLTEKRGSKGFMEVQKDMIEGANIAKEAKKHMEKVLGEDVVTGFNRLTDRQKKGRAKKKLR